MWLLSFWYVVGDVVIPIQPVKLAGYRYALFVLAASGLQKRTNDSRKWFACGAGGTGNEVRVTVCPSWGRSQVVRFPKH